MWTPADNTPETTSPSAPKVNDTINVTLNLPGSETNREFKLRVMDDADYSAGDQTRARTSLALIDADLDVNLCLSGTVVIPKRWSGRTIRVGFVPANGDERGYGGVNTITIP
jgi:hypothetical protein